MLKNICSSFYTEIQVLKKNKVGTINWNSEHPGIIFDLSIWANESILYGGRKPFKNKIETVPVTVLSILSKLPFFVMFKT